MNAKKVLLLLVSALLAIMLALPQGVFAQAENQGDQEASGNSDENGATQIEGKVYHISRDMEPQSGRILKLYFCGEFYDPEDNDVTYPFYFSAVPFAGKTGKVAKAWSIAGYLKIDDEEQVLGGRLNIINAIPSLGQTPIISGVMLNLNTGSGNSHMVENAPFMDVENPEWVFLGKCGCMKSV